MQDLIDIIDRGFDAGGRMHSDDEQSALVDAVRMAIDELDAGQARVAEKVDGNWHVNQWLKKAVLLGYLLLFVAQLSLF